MERNGDAVKPSDYELEAWRKVHVYKGRPLSRAMRNAGDQVAAGAAGLGSRASAYLESRPRAHAAVSKAQAAVAKSAEAAGAGARKATDALPDSVTGWSGTAFVSIRNTVGRVSRVGL